MNRSLYPDNWEEIAHQVKEAAGWICQRCDKECYRPDQYPDGPPVLDRRFVLTVHHKDGIPANCARDNLEALCAPCHLRAEAARRRMARARRSGQLPLFDWP